MADFLVGRVDVPKNNNETMQLRPSARVGFCGIGSHFELNSYCTTLTDLGLDRQVKFGPVLPETKLVSGIDRTILEEEIDDLLQPDENGNTPDLIVIGSRYLQCDMAGLSSKRPIISAATCAARYCQEHDIQEAWMLHAGMSLRQTAQANMPELFRTTFEKACIHHAVKIIKHDQPELLYSVAQLDEIMRNRCDDLSNDDWADVLLVLLQHLAKVVTYANRFGGTRNVILAHPLLSTLATVDGEVLEGTGSEMVKSQEEARALDFFDLRIIDAVTLLKQEIVKFLLS